jgi:hypothetical protein
MRLASGKNRKPYLKNNKKQKRAEVMAQVVKDLPNEHIKDPQSDGTVD